jgi:hypothetical protein
MARLSLAGAPGNPRLSLGGLELPDVTATIVARTGAPRAFIVLDVEKPLLLSPVHRVAVSRWQPGERVAEPSAARWQPSVPEASEAISGWQSGAPASAATAAPWRPSARLLAASIAHWQFGDALRWDVGANWGDAPPLRPEIAARWQSGAGLRWDARDLWRAGLPLLSPGLVAAWRDGARRSTGMSSRWQHGLLLHRALVEVWQRAGYPGPYRPGPEPPQPPIPIPWGARLCLSWPLEGGRLHIGRVSCLAIVPAYVIPIRRTYVTVNAASLVRWPDLTPLPVTRMTVETDFGSWCWALSATLVGPGAWDAVEPDPTPVEVLATINGQAWRFVLDTPTRRQKFADDRVEVRGRSRSAWLADPYALPSVRDESNAREMVQLAEAALDGTDWTLQWDLENWLVPAGRYRGYTTPIEALRNLVRVTDDGLYTDPTAEVLTAYKKWPVAAWLVDGLAPAIEVPSAAILTLDRTPVYSPPLSGVYVSGTTHGALALVRVDGTDGAAQPPEPLVHELLCDTAGVAARQRGLNALSDSGPGYRIAADTLFNPEASPAFPLLPPGQVATLASVKGVTRAVRIAVTWASGLQVIQSVELERRDVA